MARIRQRQASIWLALVAAIMLVLQPAGRVAAANAGPALDIFGNPLCITSEDGAGHADPQDGGRHGADCCLLGCGTTAAAQPPVPLALAIGWPRETSAAPVPAAAFVHSEPGHEPGNPRAPPPTA